MAITPATNHGLGNAFDPPYNFCLLSILGTFHAGSQVLGWVVLQDTTVSVTGWTDDTTGGPMAFSRVAAITVASMKVELWATAVNGGKAGGSYLKATFDNACRDAAGVCYEATGVVALGANTTTSGSTANPSVTRTMQDTNNYWVSGFGTVGSTLATALTGTLERTVASDGVNPLVCSLVDNTVAGAASVTDAITRTAVNWAAIGVELRSAAGTVASRGSLTLMGMG